MNEKIQIREILKSIVEKTGADPELIQHFLNELSAAIEEGLARDGKVRIQDLGTFTLKWHNPRTGRNVQTGEAIEIPGQYKVHFQPMKSLKLAVNHKYAHLKPVMLDEIVTEETESTQFMQTTQPELPLTQSDHSLIETNLSSQENELSPPPMPIPSHTEKGTSGQHPIPVPLRKKPSNPYRRAIVGLSLLLLLLSFLVIYLYLDRFRQAQPFAPQLTQNDRMADLTQTQPGEKGDNSTLMDSSKPQIVDAAPPNQSTAVAPIERTVALSDQKSRTSELANSGGLKFYQINPGDNLWDLAGQYYADPFWWPYIYQSNLSDLPNPDVLDIGQNLKIPALRRNVLSPSPDEQKKLALGYFNAYLVYQKISEQQAFPFIRQAILYDSTLLSSRRYEIATSDYQRLYLMRDQLKKEYSGK